VLLTPLDIHQMEFRIVWRGYDKDQVDEFMDSVFREYEDLYKQNEQLKEKISQLEARLDDFAKLESGINETLTAAQDAAQDRTQAAEVTAEAIIRDARSKAEEMVAKARSQTREELQRLEKARAEGRSFRIQLRSMLKSYLDLLEEMESMTESEGDRTAAMEAAAGGDETDW